MKILITILIILLVKQISVGQNLIPNSSFESMVNCPTGSNNSQVLATWFNPTGASPDYYNLCAGSTSGAGVPLNWGGYQLPQDGNGYIGLVTYNSPTIQEYREYMEVKLLTPLVAGKVYYWCMWISPLDSMNLASDNLGISLSNTMMTSTNQTTLNSTVYANYKDVVLDNVGWTEIAGSITAQGGEEYLIIGNFYNDAQTNTIQVRQNTTNGNMAGYYVDAIYLGEVSCLVTEIEVNIPNVLTPNMDGSNDLFQLAFPFNKVEIFNRWGQKIFEAKNNEAHWDGRTTTGKEAPNGTYFYVIDTGDEIYKGYVELLR